MVLIPVLCPHCHSDQVIKGGKTKAGKQRYKCQNVDCGRYSFQLDLTYKGLSPDAKSTSSIWRSMVVAFGIRSCVPMLRIIPVA